LVMPPSSSSESEPLPGDPIEIEPPPLAGVIKVDEEPVTVDSIAGPKD